MAAGAGDVTMVIDIFIETKHRVFLIEACKITVLFSSKAFFLLILVHKSCILGGILSY